MVQLGSEGLQQGHCWLCCLVGRLDLDSVIDTLKCRSCLLIKCQVSPPLAKEKTLLMNQIVLLEMIKKDSGIVPGGISIFLVPAS